MWRRVVLWQASALLVTGFLDIGYFSQKPRYESLSQMNCYEYPDHKTDRLMKLFNPDWRFPRLEPKHFMALPSTIYTSNVLPGSNELLVRRIDTFLPQSTDVVKEHAKLVQDINSLKQILYVAPLTDDNRDYDDSVFHEIIETSSTTTPRPTMTRTYTKSSSIPVILLGGASQRQVVKSHPLQFTKPTINLVGTTSNPLLKHPYPFVMQSSSRKPVKICMSSYPTPPSTRRPPSLWERLINAIIPR